MERRRAFQAFAGTRAQRTSERKRHKESELGLTGSGKNNNNKTKQPL